MSEPVDVGLHNFETEVISAPVPVLIDFWAPWCGPCRSIGPILQSLAGQHAGRMKVVKINVDDEKELAGHFGVQGIPALFVMRDAKLVDRMVGFKGRGPLQELFDKHALPA